MRVAVLFSGGKDSVLATSWTLKQGFDPILVTVKPPEYSMMFHHPNIEFTKYQAQAMELPQEFVETTEENWRGKLIEKLRQLQVKGIVTGAIASQYQKKRIDSVAAELGIPAYAPLWHREKEILEEIRDFEVYVTAVSAEGLDEKFLGQPFQKIVDARLSGIHLLLEGGEGETFVTYAPFFKKRIVIKSWDKSFDGVRGIAKIKEIEIKEKSS
ncbi:diphthine--ammonia ligase [Candidatus Micrarchaeota archaeon]|nr:diphthine--ammonia ligase [Candidatus Micrarchaeota archaeon]